MRQLHRFEPWIAMANTTLVCGVEQLTKPAGLLIKKTYVGLGVGNCSSSNCHQEQPSDQERPRWQYMAPAGLLRHQGRAEGQL